MRKQLWLVGVVCLTVGGIQPVQGADGDPPRYKLHPGQVLTYHQASEFRHKSGTSTEAAESHFQVVRANPDGSWHLIFDAKVHSAATDKAKPTSRGILQEFAEKITQKVAPASAGDIQHKLAEFDLFPDGRVVISDSVDAIRSDPTDYFAVLPTSARQASQGWTTTDSGPSHNQIHYRTTRHEGAEWQIAGVFDRLWDKVYDASLRQQITFDAERGLIRRIETADTMKFAWDGAGDGWIELVAESDLTAAELTRLAAEAAIYFPARSRYFALATATDENPAATIGRLDAAAAALRDIQPRLSLPLFTAAISQALAQDKQFRSYSIEQAKKRADVIGQPTADWELSDLTGQTHSLAKLKGQVVVLDFWYRGCGWCVRAMPQMKGLTDDFRGQPVAIFGMNTDKNVQDAQLVAGVVGLNYPTLRAEGMPEKHNVQTFPTLIIIGPDGRVADVHIGYTPTLRSEVGATIRRLLTGEPRAALNAPGR